MMTRCWKIAVGTVVALATLTLTGLVAPVAASNTTDQFVTISVKEIEAIPWQSNRSVNAVVTVSADRAVSGSLRVTDSPEGSEARTVWEYDLDLAAGSSVAIPVRLTTGWDGISAQVTYTANGEVIGAERFNAFPHGEGGEATRGVVGVLGAVDPPRAVPEIGTDYKLSTIQLDLSLSGLSRVASVVAEPAAVQELKASPAGVALDSWVRNGGQLVIDGQPGSLGPDYEQGPTANPNRFTYGSGSVVFEPQWRDGIPMGGVIGTSGLDRLVEDQGLGVGSAAELGLLAGLNLPPAWLIAVVLLVYAVVAGPLLFGFAQGRRSSGLIWTALPLLSLSLAAVVLGFGFFSRTGRSSAHVTIVEVAADQGSRSTADLLLVSRLGGDQTVEAGPGWEFLGQGRGASGRSLVLRPTTTQLDVGTSLPAGGAALLRFEGPTPDYDGWLTIDDIDVARNDAGNREVTATVANNSPADLSHVVVFLGNTREQIEDLPAGGTQQFTIEADESELRTMGELSIWPGVRREWVPQGFDEAEIAVPRDPDAPTAAGAWTAWRIDQGSSAVGPNTLGVAGWSEGLPSPLGNIDTGRTALFVREELPSSGTDDATFTGTFRLHHSNDKPDFFGPTGAVVWMQDYRFTLGAGTDPDRVAVRLNGEAAGLSFWTPEGWRWGEDLPDRGDAVVAIPPEAVIDGEIQFRAALSEEHTWDVGVSAWLTSSPSDIEQAQQLQLVSQETFRQGAFDFLGPPSDEQEVVDVAEIEREPAADGSLPPVVSSVSFPFIAPGSYSSVWLPVEAGENLRVTMRSMGDWYLEVIPEFDPATSNDELGEETDSQVEMQFSQDQMVEIRVMGLNNGEVGDVTVEVEVTK